MQGMERVTSPIVHLTHFFLTLTPWIEQVPKGTSGGLFIFPVNSQYKKFSDGGGKRTEKIFIQVQ